MLSAMTTKKENTTERGRGGGHGGKGVFKIKTGKKDQLARAESVRLSSGGKGITEGGVRLSTFYFHLVDIKLSRGLSKE